MAMTEAQLRAKIRNLVALGDLPNERISHVRDVGSGFAADEASGRLRGKPRRSTSGLMELWALTG